MSFPHYPKYKASGVEWLGDVPAHWELKRVGFFFSERREKVSDKDYPALSVTKNGIVPQIETAAKTDDGDNRKLVCSGDFVINSRSDRKGSSGISVLNGSVSLICTVLRPMKTVYPLFIHHLLRCSPFQEEFYRYGKGIVADLWSTNYSEMRNILLSMPPLDEQTAIAGFLDRETSKIDALVAEQQRLVELLKEKRQAVISHAVTKGLNPAAPMKPSGIEWIGAIPAHWLSIPIKFVARLESGHTPSRQHPEYWENCTVPWFSLADVWQIREGKKDVVIETNEKVSELGLANSSARLLPQGTVILSRTASVGFSAIMGTAMATTQDFANWICGPKLFNEFLLFTFRAMREEFNRIMMGSTHNTIYMPDIEAFHMALPPLDEQTAILDSIRTETAKLDTLTAEAQRAIELLQERRTALISAAVTGKIDVRTIAQKETA
ncbi:MAG: restriction endonuclease subunit S [Deltaproteobacteria bacterium HGW-Deltaproteobacteria-22]|jgi:type I restriction enzyme S subunit|nr:MAG: restriction endonuclease subunit S [Deltaproteobacteria bacterium HGW-Deltaproteobacteria-22]